MGVLLQSCLQDSVLEPNEIDHFLKGELDPRPTFQRAFVPSKKTGQSYCTYGSLKNEEESVMPKCLPSVCLLLHVKCFLIWEMVFILPLDGLVGENLLALLD